MSANTNTVILTVVSTAALLAAYHFGFSRPAISRETQQAVEIIHDEIRQANEQAVKNAVRNKILFEGISSAGGLRTDIALFLADHGRMPNSLNEIGWAGGVTSVNLSAIEMRSGGILALHFNPEKLRGTIILTPQTNMEALMIIGWSCTSPDIDFIAEALPECRYLR